MYVTFYIVGFPLHNIMKCCTSPVKRVGVALSETNMGPIEIANCLLKVAIPFETRTTR